MGNVLNSLKRFVSNKNTVTILGVIAGVIVLYIGYNWRVKQATDPIPNVPYAKVEIGSRTKITADMIGYMQVPKSLAKNDNLVTNSSLVVGKYVSYGTTIPANSLFYKSSLMTAEELPDSAFENIPDGYTVYSLSVTLATTYGNSIFPGNYIDLYFKGVDDTGKIIFGRLIESIEVLAVKDSQGQHVFESTVENRIPSELQFAVPNDMFSLLMKAKFLGSSVQVLPVPRNASYSANPGETQVSSDYIREFILSKSTIIPEDDYYTPNTNYNNNNNQ